ncbi:MAG: OmpA family protein [Cyclobacteriaceae bacterium]
MNPFVSLGLKAFVVWSVICNIWYLSLKGQIDVTDPTSFKAWELVANLFKGEEPEASEVVSADDKKKKRRALPFLITENKITFQKNSDQYTDSVFVNSLFKEWKLKAENRKIELTVVGHTCDLGTNKHNDALGMKRAEKFKADLEKMGFNVEVVKISSQGENSPLVDNDSEENRSKNRRVEVKIKSIMAPS